MANIRKGDTVYVLTGESKGKTGRVLWVNPKKKQLLVEGVNMVKQHQRPTQKTPKGGIITKESPIHISNVALFVNSDQGPMPTRVKTKRVSGEKGSAVRIARRTGEQL